MLNPAMNINSSRWGVSWSKVLSTLRGLKKGNVTSILSWKKSNIERINLTGWAHQAVKGAEVVTRDWVNTVLVDWVTLRNNDGYVREFWDVEHINM